MTTTFRSVAALGTVLLLGACARGGGDDMSWARAALARNPSIEVVAVDTQGRTFTVRVKGTSELRIVRVDDIVGLPGAAGAPPSATPQATAAPPAGPATPASAPAPTAAEAATPAAPGMPAAPPMPATAFAAPAAHPPAPASMQASLVPQQPTAAPGQERVLESGPGYTIRAVGNAAPATTVPGITSSPVQRRHEPIICQGSRLIHIDNLNLVFDGDAVSAEDGCEIHITNSHISATGVGVSVRAANVHIDNCLIEGKQASIDASEGAQVYATDTRFRGLSRRLDDAAFHDLGGNIWN